MSNPKFLRLRWVDQVTGDPQKTTDFYSTLLGFGKLPVEEPNDCTSYCLTNEDGEEIFGIVDETNFPNWPHGWVLYFEVEDSAYDERCKTAEMLGGEILSKSDLFCVIKDPSGAPMVISPAKQIAEVEGKEC